MRLEVVAVVVILIHLSYGNAIVILFSGLAALAGGLSVCNRWQFLRSFGFVVGFILMENPEGYFEAKVLEFGPAGISRHGLRLRSVQLYFLRLLILSLLVMTPVLVHGLNYELVWLPSLAVPSVLLVTPEACSVHHQLGRLSSLGVQADTLKSPGNISCQTRN